MADFPLQVGLTTSIGETDTGWVDSDWFKVSVKKEAAFDIAP